MIRGASSRSAAARTGPRKVRPSAFESLGGLERQRLQRDLVEFVRRSHGQFVHHYERARMTEGRARFERKTLQLFERQIAVPQHHERDRDLALDLIGHRHDGGLEYRGLTLE